jgi:hypothetical protein
LCKTLEENRAFRRLFSDPAVAARQTLLTLQNCGVDAVGVPALTTAAWQSYFPQATDSAIQACFIALSSTSGNTDMSVLLWQLPL